MTPNTDFSEAYFLLHTLQNIYFNSNHLTKPNKLCCSRTLSLNKTTKALLQQTKAYAPLAASAYSKPSIIEPVLLAMYRYLKARTNSCHLVSADRTIAINPLRMSEYPDADLNYLAPLRSLVRRVNRRAKSDCAFKGVFLSNSLVSNDYAKGYSDLDIVVVLGDAAFQSVATVRRVQRKITSWLRFLFCFDSAQHHPFTVLTDVQLGHYFESILPTLIFERHSRNLIESAVELSFRCVSDDSHKTIALRHSVSLLNQHIRKPDRALWRPFDLKDMTSQVTLLIVYFIQYTKGYVYKRDAIRLAYEVLTNTDALKTAEHIRRTFPCIRYRGIRYCPPFVHPTALLSVRRKWSLRRPPIDIPTWKAQVVDLVDEIERKCDAHDTR